MIRNEKKNVVLHTVIESIDHCGCRKGSKVLRQKVDWNFFPVKLLADRHGQRDRGVQVASGHPARDKNAQHDSDAKAPIDAEKVPRSTFAEYRLGYRCIAEHLYEHRS